jgi:hypothetical protein
MLFVRGGDLEWRVSRCFAKEQIDRAVAGLSVMCAPMLAGSMFAYRVVCGEKRRSGVSMAEAQQVLGEQCSGDGGVRDGMLWYGREECWGGGNGCGRYL